MSTVTLLLFGTGFALLILGAELLVRGASRLAASLGVSPLVIGLTIVAYGTSTPELAVSIEAGLAGQTDISLGNVVGSNIFNVLFILGISALICPLTVSHQLIRWDVPIMIAVSFASLLVCVDGQLSRAEGCILLAGIVAYTILLIKLAKRPNNAQAHQEYSREYGPGDGTPKHNKTICLAYCAVGLIALVMGTRWFVDGAAALAAAMGVSQLVIGLTIVAAGTSMPEVFTSVVAAIRGERDIAVGNVVGSNIYNILAILGASSAITPGGLTVSPHLLWVDTPIMIGVAVACLPIFFTGHRIARWEGALFFSYYVAYTAYLVLKSTENNENTLAGFKGAMLYFVLPLTVVTLAMTSIRAVRNPQANPPSN